jgi:hypothetical protein
MLTNAKACIQWQRQALCTPVNAIICVDVCVTKSLIWGVDDRCAWEMRAYCEYFRDALSPESGCA